MLENNKQNNKTTFFIIYLFLITNLTINYFITILILLLLILTIAIKLIICYKNSIFIGKFQISGGFSCFIHILCFTLQVKKLNPAKVKP